MGGDRAAASFDPGPAIEPAADSGYPPLQTVPPRPQLSYTVQQQRQIVEALIADRENARYTSQVVRHRSGLSSLPPPPVPPEPAAPIDIEPPIAVRDGPAPEPSLIEHRTLIDFLSALLFDGSANDLDEPGAGDDRAEEGGGQAQTAPADAAAQLPVPPVRSAIAARLAAGPDLIDALVDETVPQTPLPPGQPALARLAAAEETAQPADPPSAAPLPAARPVAAVSADAQPPAPPPVKPIVPIGAVSPPTPVEKPADYGSAAARAPGSAQAGPVPGGAPVAG